MRRKLLSIILTLAMVLTLVPAFSAPVKADATYTKVTNVSQLAEGDVIILGQEDRGSYASAMETNKFFGHVTAQGSAIEITLGKSGNNWTLTTAEGTIGATAAKNLNHTGSGTTTWTIEIDSDGLATIASTESSYGRILYNHNNNNPRYMNYTSTLSTTMQLPSIYKKSGSHTHSYGSWTSNGDGTHTRSCTCGATETGNCVDANSDNVCDVCNGAMPVSVTYTLNDVLHEGDQVVIVHTSDNMAMTATASGKKLAGVAVTPSNGQLTVTGSSVAVMTVEYKTDSNTQFKLKSADNKYLTSGATGNGVSFEDTANEYSLWTVEIADATAKTVYIHNVNAAYNNKAQSLEYYSGFTTYGTNTTAAYIFSLYTIVNENAHVLSYVSNDDGTHNIICSYGNACTEGHNQYDVDCTYQDTVTPATYEAAGTITHVCEFCGYSYTETTDPALDPVTLYPATTLEGATKVVFFAAVTDNNTGFDGVALSSDLASTQAYYLAANPMTMDDPLQNPAPATIWTVTENQDGTYTFTCGDKTLASAITTTTSGGNEVTHYNIYNAAGTNDTVWTLEADGDAFYLKSGVDVYVTYSWYANGNLHEFKGGEEAATAFFLYTDVNPVQPEFSGYSITLGNTIDPDGDGDLLVNFYIDGVAAADVSNYFVEFDFMEETRRAQLEYVEGKGVRASIQVFMKDYDEEIVAYLYDSDYNELDSVTLTNGVKTYINEAPASVENIVDALDTLCDLVKELLVAGHTATKAPAADHATDLGAFAPEVTTLGDGSDITLRGISLIMEDKVSLRVFVKTAEDLYGDLDGNDIDPVAGATANSYSFVLTGFTRLNLGTAHELMVYTDLTTITIGNLSPLSYAYLVVNSQASGTTLYKIANALYEYYTAEN